MDPFAYSSESETSAHESPLHVDPAPEVQLVVKPVVDLEGVKLAPNHMTGYVEQYKTDHFHFENQYYTFENYGYAANPADFRFNSFVKRPERAVDEFRTVFEQPSELQKAVKRSVKARRLRNDDPTTEGFLGPWGPYIEEQELLATKDVPITEEQKTRLAETEVRRAQVVQEHKENPKVQDYEKTEIVVNEPRVECHLANKTDYQGRSFIRPPSDLKRDPNQSAYIPKECTQVLAGHTKGVQCVKFFPEHGHLLLSASLDNTVKLWDAVGRNKCVQTYSGHSNSVRDVCFNTDGTQFLSCSYDRLIRLWDTETGQVIVTFKCRRIPYCVRYNPDPEKQSSFIVGTANRRINQYDTVTGKKVQIYDEHLGAVNSVLFVDDYRKFISTSDDKKIFLWEFGIPVVVKHISEPHMHAVPYTALHPTNRHFVGQALDNKLVVFEARGGFRLNRRKKFEGHMNGGFACAIAFSPDGKFVASGDFNGRVWFWDWKTTRNFKTLEAHDDVVLGLDWHPVIPSRVATASWDGVIKIWD